MNDFHEEIRETRKMPEFIIVEDARQQESYRTQEPEMSFQAFQNLQSTRYPLFLRLLFLGLAIIFSFVALILLPLLLVSLALTVITFFRFQGSLDYNTMLWKRIKKIIVLSLGFFVAVFLPPLGLGIIILYFMFMGEEVNPFLKTHFMQFN